MHGHTTGRSIQILLGAWLAAVLWACPGYAAIPGTPVLKAPLGIVGDLTPIYTWRAVADATAYRLWVTDSTGNRIARWYRATAVGCAAGTGLCTVTPDVVLTPGAVKWQVRARNTDGLGPWSRVRRVTVVEPSGSERNLIVPGDRYDYVTDQVVGEPLFQAMWRVLHESNARCWIAPNTLTQYQFYEDPSFLPGPLYRFSGIEVSAGQLEVYNIGWYYRPGQTTPLRAAYVSAAIGDFLLGIVDNDTIAEVFWHSGQPVVTYYNAGTNCM